MNEAVGCLTCGGLGAAVASPMIGIFDKAVVQYSAAVCSLQESVLQSFRTLVRQPGHFLCSPLYSYTWLAYTGSYAMSNLADRFIVGNPSQLSDAQLKQRNLIKIASIVSLANVTMIARDQAFARLYGAPALIHSGQSISNSAAATTAGASATAAASAAATTSPAAISTSPSTQVRMVQRMPKSTLCLWIVRSIPINTAAFVLPPYVCNYLRPRLMAYYDCPGGMESEMIVPSESTLKLVSQTGLVLIGNVFGTFFHLLGLDCFLHEGATWTQHFHNVRGLYMNTLAVSSVRIFAPFVVGPLVSSHCMKQSGLSYAQ